MGKTKNRGYVFFGCLLLFALGFIASGNQLVLLEVVIQIICTVNKFYQWHFRFHKVF